MCVNGDDDVAAMTRWSQQLNRLGAHTSAEALMPGPPQDWVLEERRLLNSGSPGGEAWHLGLAPKDPAQLNWTAGDIAEIWPRNSEDAVTAFLARHKLDGELSFRWRGQWTFLRDIIAHSRLPSRMKSKALLCNGWWTGWNLSPPANFPSPRCLTEAAWNCWCARR